MRPGRAKISARIAPRYFLGLIAPDLSCDKRVAPPTVYPNCKAAFLKNFPKCRDPKRLKSGAHKHSEVVNPIRAEIFALPGLTLPERRVVAY